MSNIKNKAAFNIVLTFLSYNFAAYASELTGAQNNGSTPVAASSFSAKATEWKNDLYSKFNNLKSSITNYTRPYHPYGFALTLGGGGALNLYNAYACTTADRFTRYFAGSVGLSLLGLSFYETYKKYMKLAQDKQLEQQAQSSRKKAFKESYDELKEYVRYILSSVIFTRLTAKSSDVNNFVASIKKTLIDKKDKFNYAQSNLESYPDEYNQLSKEEKLSDNRFVQKIILDNLGASIALTKNTEGNYIIDPNNSANKALNQHDISKKLTAIFSAPHEFSFDKELIESFLPEQQNASASGQPEQKLEPIYIEHNPQQTLEKN